MTRAFRLASFLMTLTVVLGSHTASADGLPSPGNSTISATRINLVGFDANSAGDRADSLSAFAKLTITVRDIANNPLPGKSVVLDFSGCTSDVRIASVQSFHDETAVCLGSTVQGYTTTNGTISFVVIGGRTGSTAHPRGCARAYADGDLLGQLGVGTYDHDNASGLTLADLGAWGTDFFGGANPDRSDYNGDAAVTISDLSIWGSAYFGGRSGSSGAVLCP